MKSWLAYTAAFVLALLSAFGGYYVGFRIVMSGSGFGIAGFFAIVVLAPVTVGFGVFVISYAAFSDRWLGWMNTLVGSFFVLFVSFASFLLIKDTNLDHRLMTILPLLTLFAGGRLLLWRASLV